MEIESLSALDAALRTPTGLRGTRWQGLDLRTRESDLLSRNDFHGVTVLGGLLSPALAQHIAAHGGLVFPSDPECPVDCYRSRLYDPTDLYAGLDEHGYAATPDARAYTWAQDGTLARDAVTTLMRAIHDDSISDALAERVNGARVVGVMGGHGVERGTQAYAAAAALGHRLASAGLTVATGGGPGAMEAANLGAFSHNGSQLDEAIQRLAAVPSFRPSIDAWARLALDVRASLVPPVSPIPGHEQDTPPALRSLGVPTWFYGHEPPNVFCDAIAKYFSNAIREDGLLALATDGIVVTEGAAGTVQEIFQLATRLYYAPVGTPLPRLVLVGRDYWTATLPAWPLLRQLGDGRAMGDAIHLVGDVDEAADLLIDAGEARRTIES